LDAVDRRAARAARWTACVAVIDVEARVERVRDALRLALFGADTGCRNAVARNRLPSEIFAQSWRAVRTRSGVEVAEIARRPAAVAVADADQLQAVALDQGEIETLVRDCLLRVADHHGRRFA